MSLVTLSLASGTGYPGGTITLNLSIASTGGAQCTQITFLLSFTSDLTLIAVARGAAAIAANKGLARSGNTIALWDVGTEVIADGVLATITLQVSNTPSTNSIPISVTTLVASDTNGLALSHAEVPGVITSEVVTLSCPPSSAVVGNPYTGTLTPGGGTAPYTFALYSGAFPPGFSLNAASGVLSGTSSAAGSWNWVVQTTDAIGATARASCRTVVSGSAPPTPDISPCAGISAAPSTDNSFELIRVVATMEPAKHLPVRGSSR